MSAKIVLVFCTQALFFQFALSQCTSRAAVAADREIIGTGFGRRLGYGLGDAFAFDGACGWGLDRAFGLDAPYGLAGPAIDITPTVGGGLPVASASAFTPVGLAVESENIYEGILAAAGELPFVGTVGVEGVLPTAGVGAVHHRCGDGINAMVSDNVGYAGAYGNGLDAPLALEAPLGSAAPLGIAAPGLGYRAGWAGRGCGCGIY